MDCTITNPCLYLRSINLPGNSGAAKRGLRVTGLRDLLLSCLFSCLACHSDTNSLIRFYRRRNWGNRTDRQTWEDKSSLDIITPSNLEWLCLEKQYFQVTRSDTHSQVQPVEAGKSLWLIDMTLKVVVVVFYLYLNVYKYFYIYMTNGAGSRSGRAQDSSLVKLTEL